MCVESTRIWKESKFFKDRPSSRPKVREQNYIWRPYDLASIWDSILKNIFSSDEEQGDFSAIYELLSKVFTHLAISMKELVQKSYFGFLNVEEQQKL